MKRDSGWWQFTEICLHHSITDHVTGGWTSVGWLTWLQWSRVEWGSRSETETEWMNWTRKCRLWRITVIHRSLQIVRLQQWQTTSLIFGAQANLKLDIVSHRKTLNVKMMNIVSSLALLLYTSLFIYFYIVLYSKLIYLYFLWKTKPHFFMQPSVVQTLFFFLMKTKFYNLCVRSNTWLKVSKMLPWASKLG